MMILLDTRLSLQAARWFDAPPRRVFQAWLHESWGEWQAPGAAWCTSSIVNPKPGGRFSLTMRMPDGEEASIHGVYRQIMPMSRIVLAWTPEGEAETTITLTFRPVSEGTHLTLCQDGFVNALSRDRHHADWTGRNGAFHKLGRFLRDGF